MADGKTIYAGLIARGFTAPQAAALTGNIQQESGFQPGVVNKASGAKGLGQWLGPRKAALDAYATATGRSPDDADTQLDYIVHEMQGPEAKSSGDFLRSTDVKTASQALKKYFRYGPGEEGKRLDYALSYTDAPSSDAIIPPTPTESGFVQPAGFTGNMPNPDAAPPTAPLQAPGPLAPDTMSKPGGNSDDDLLKSFLGDPSAAGNQAATPATPDDELLTKFLTGPDAEAAPADPLEGTTQLFPGADTLSAAFTSGMEALPVVGPTVMGGLEHLKSGVQGLLGHPQTPEQIRAVDQEIQKQQPAATTVGTLAGTVGPYLIGGSTILGGKLLGTAGSMAERLAAGGLSSATIQGLDTAARGGSPEDIAKSALEGGVLGAGSSALLGGKLLARTLGGAAIGGGMTAAEGGSPEDIGKNALIGGASGAAFHGLAAAGNKLLSGTPAVVASLAKTAMDKYHIPVEAAQMSTNPLVRHAGDIVNKIPGLGGSAAKGKQVAAFNYALAKEMGETADTLTPDVFAAARDRIGSVFDSVAQKVPVIKADPQFQNEIMQAVTDAESTLEAAKLGPIEKQFNNIVTTFGNGGQITGDQYLSLTAKNSVLSKAIAQGGDIGQVASEMKDALYGALERNAPPDLVKQLQQARYQWKVMRTLENPAAKSPTGEISPANLMGPVVKNFGGKAFGQAGNMGELADIGQRLLKDPNSSQTAERGAVMLGIDKLLHSPIAAVGAGGLALTQPGVLAGAAANAPLIAGGLLVSRLAAGGMRSKSLANKLIANTLRTAPSKLASPLSIGARAAVPLATQASDNVFVVPPEMQKYLQRQP